MADINRPPTKDEIQYAKDLIHGRHKIDVILIIGSAIFGGVLGIAIATANALSDHKPFDPIFCLICIVACGACLAVVTGLVVASLRAIVNLCRTWKPALILTLVAAAIAALQLLQALAFSALFPSYNSVPHFAMLIMACVFALLILNPILRLIFLVYCTITGKDDEEILARNIAAQAHRQAGKPGAELPDRTEQPKK